MNRNQREQHAIQVDAWIEKSVNGLSQAAQAQIFKDAVEVIEKRILATLSAITWNAILDRALIRSAQSFPLLSGIKIQLGGISIDGLLLNLQDQKANQVIEAFRFLLIEILTIVGNLTAGVLTEPLYRELFRFVANSNSRTDREDV